MEIRKRTPLEEGVFLFFSWFSTFFFCFVEHSYGANHQLLKKNRMLTSSS